MPPYSMPVSSTARSIDRNDALRTSRVRLTRLLTSARVSARTTQAATRSSPSRLPATTTQFALAVSGTSYASVIAAVSASSGSISTTATSAACGQPARARATGAPSSSGCSSAGRVTREPSVGSDHPATVAAPDRHLPVTPHPSRLGGIGGIRSARSSSREIATRLRAAPTRAPVLCRGPSAPPPPPGDTACHPSPSRRWGSRRRPRPRRRPARPPRHRRAGLGQHVRARHQRGVRRRRQLRRAVHQRLHRAPEHHRRRRSRWPA